MKNFSVTKKEQRRDQIKKEKPLTKQKKMKIG